MNLWFWPYLFQAQQAEMYWQPGVGLIETLRRYAAFYVVTSLWWDIQAISAGLFGVPLGFVVIILVSLVTPRPSQATQNLVEHVRYPSLRVP